jgi:hypothetical protein
MPCAYGQFFRFDLRAVEGDVVPVNIRVFRTVTNIM